MLKNKTIMRRYDLDWLRVLVFGLLIFYHVGMFFVPWDYHIKNNVIYEWLVWPMLFINQWRLPILFIISGMGTFYALSSRKGRQFIAERLIRLFIPLAAGMLIVVPPQVYFERVAKGQFSGSFLDFWPSEAFTGSYPKGNLSWHHLWFLVYLLVFSLLLLPVFLYLRKNLQCGFLNLVRKVVNKPAGIFIFIIPLFLAEYFLRPVFPTTHALVNDWFTLIHYLLLFFFGYILISVKDTFWPVVQKNRTGYLVSGLLFFALFIYQDLFLEQAGFIFFTKTLAKVLNMWSWILAIFGFAATCLNRNSKILAYCNEAVYPFYILHQTVIIAAGFYLMNMELNFIVKASIMVVTTFGICFLLYEFFIRRISFLRPLFGLKISPRVHKNKPDAYSQNPVAASFSGNGEKL